MTWEQFVATVLGLAAMALARLLDRYLPSRRERRRRAEGG